MESKNIFEVNGIKYSSNIPPQTKICLNQEEYAEYLQLKNDSIPKQVIRDKFYEVAQKRKKYWGKEYPQQLSKAEFIKSMKMLGVIKFCEELLGE